MHGWIAEALETRLLLSGTTQTYDFAGELVQEYDAGADVVSVASGDLNGDGSPDLVTGNRSASTVSVLFNRGDGRFLPPVAYDVAFEPLCVVAADLDGDGAVDLVATTAHGMVSVLGNDGHGVFASPVNYDVGGDLPSVAVADVNQDGRIDLVIADSNGGAVVLRNSGQGKFAAPVRYDVAGGPAVITAADVNGDGAPDLVTANPVYVREDPAERPTSISVLWNLGDGTFGGDMAYATDAAAVAVTAADVDGDGYLDLAVADESGVVSIFGNAGDGTFSLRARPAVGPRPRALTAVDVDDDGAIDLVTANYDSGTVSILRNTGDGTFAPETEYVVGTHPAAVIAVDVDGDRQPDLVTAGSPWNSVYVTRNAGSGTFAAIQAIRMDNAYVKSSLGGIDGRPELLLIDPLSRSISVRRNMSNGTFSEVAKYQFATTPSAAVAADFDNDGNSDLIVAVGSSSTPDFLVMWGMDDGAFAPAELLFRGAKGSLSARYLDGGSWAALVATDQYTTLWLNRGDRTFSEPLTFGGENVTIVDINGDHNPDLITTGRSPRTLDIRLNTGDWTFPTTTRYPFPEDDWDLQIADLEIADMDGDGRPDVVCAGSRQLWVWCNLGQGLLAAPVTQAIAGSVRGIATADVDGDDAMDIILIQANPADVRVNAISVLLNRGNLEFLETAPVATGNTPQSVMAADIDRDQRVDLMSFDSSARTITILHNRVQPPTVSICATGASSAAPVNFSIIFSEPVHGLAAGDFALSGSAGPTKLQITGAGTTYNVAVTGMRRTGTVALRLRYHAVADAVGNLSTEPAEATARWEYQRPVVQFAASGMSVMESGRSAAIHVYRQGNTSVPVSVHYATGGGTAVPGKDYVPVSGTLRFAAGQTTARIALRLRYDMIAEDRETVKLSLGAPTGGAALGPARSMVLTIVDDDERVAPTATAEKPVGIGDGRTEFTVRVRYADNGALNLSSIGNGDIWVQSPRGEVLDGELAWVVASEDAASAVATYRVLSPGGLLDPSDNGTYTIWLRSGSISDQTGILAPKRQLRRFQVALTPASGTAASAPAFGYARDAAPEYGWNGRTEAVASADFNGDGMPDLAVAGFYSAESRYQAANSISVFFNRGDGTYADPVHYESEHAYNIAALDVDNDGHVDLVVYGNGEMRALQNLGDGTFRLRSRRAFSEGVDSIVVADLNDDGKADLATTGHQGVSVWLNRGDWSFYERSYTSASSASRPEATCTAVADLDGDGDLDLATTCAETDPDYRGTVWVRLNRGDGKFLPETVYRVGMRSCSITAADLDGDGKADLVAVNQEDGEETLSILRNTGNGTFAPEVRVEAGPDLWCVTSLDVDADGMADLALVHTESNTVSVLRNLGGFAFAPVNYCVGDQPWQVITADVDRDGNVDLLTANREGCSVSVLRNRGNGSFQGLVASPLQSGPNSIAAADVNGDGAMDLVATEPSASAVVVLENLGQREFAPPVAYPVGTSPRSVAAADLDGDGRMDLVTANYTETGSDAVSVLWGMGDGTFAPSASYAGDQHALLVVTVDLNLDGMLDIVTAGQGSVTVLLNGGDRLFAKRTTYQNNLDAVALAVADVTGDGVPDVVTAFAGRSYGGYVVALLTSEGDGTFSKVTMWGISGSVSAMATADIDDDGRLDLVLAGHSSSLGSASPATVWTMRNGGQGTFMPEVAYQAAAHYVDCYLTVADVDSDGRTDVITSEGPYSFPPPASPWGLNIFRSIGDGRLAPAAHYATGAELSSIAAADLDNDGRVDLVAAGDITNTITPLWNVASRPTVGIYAAAPTAAGSVNFDVVFSQPVSGFTAGDVLVSGTAGARSVRVSGSGTTYRVAVGGLRRSGMVVLRVAGGAAVDAGGNLSLASASPDNQIDYSLPTLQFSARAFLASEGRKSNVVTVTRTGESYTAVSVHYATTGGTGSEDDYTPVSGTLDFAPGQTSATIIAPIRRDGLVEGPETVRLALSNAAGGAALGTQRTCVLNIADIDERVAPLARLARVPTVVATSTGVIIRVTYVDNNALNLASIGNLDIDVVGTSGASYTSRLLSLASSADGRFAVAVYLLMGPDGIWDSVDNGVYSLRTHINQVLDAAGNAVPERVLGHFTVAI